MPSPGCFQTGGPAPMKEGQLPWTPLGRLLTFLDESEAAGNGWSADGYSSPPSRASCCCSRSKCCGSRSPSPSRLACLLRPPSPAPAKRAAFASLKKMPESISDKSMSDSPASYSPSLSPSPSNPFRLPPSFAPSDPARLPSSALSGSPPLAPFQPTRPASNTEDARSNASAVKKMSSVGSMVSCAATRPSAQIMSFSDVVNCKLPSIPHVMLKDSFSKKGEEKNKRADELAKEVKITK